MTTAAHLENPTFLALIPYMVFSKRKGPEETPRIEIAKHCPAALRLAALMATWPCPACGKPIHFVRTRKKSWDDRTPPNDLYLAVACPNAENLSCNRRHESSGLWALIYEAVKTNQEKAS